MREADDGENFSRACNGDGVVVDIAISKYRVSRTE